MINEWGKINGLPSTQKNRKNITHETEKKKSKLNKNEEDEKIDQRNIVKIINTSEKILHT